MYKMLIRKCSKPHHVLLSSNKSVSRKFYSRICAKKSLFSSSLNTTFYYRESIRHHHVSYCCVCSHRNDFILSQNNLKFNNNLIFMNASKRHFRLHSILYEKDSSKVEQTVKALKEEALKQEKQQQATSVGSVPAATTVAIKSEEESVVLPVKRSLGKRIWDELVHYYHGFRLLVIDIRISSRLIWKILNGGDLTRREHRQLVRTTSDVFRLVPFSVFIIVPFMELLLPVFLKLFPNMLPSTFQTSSDVENKVKKQLKLKLEMAKFLQNTLDEMTLKAEGESHSQKAKEFANFFDRIRKSGQQASNEDIIKFSKLFEDEITLDSLSRPQLVALCRLLELQPIGTNNFLRFQLRMKLRTLKADDQMISKEGVDILTVPELQQACRARGMRAIGLSEERLRSQLTQWLELSLSEHIPPSLLLLSRVLYLPENIPAHDQLKVTIQSLPQEAGTEAKYKIGETEGKIDNRTKIELLKQEEAAIKREKEEQEAMAKVAEKAGVKEKVLVDERLVDKATIQVDTDVGINPSLTYQEKTKDEKEVLSKEDIESLEDALKNISDEKNKLLIEKEELEDLKEEMQDYKEDIEEFKEISVKTGKSLGLKETKAAKRLRNKVDKMVNKMDHLFVGLESKKQSLEEKIDIMAKEGREIKSERDDVIGINELLLAIRRIQKVSDETKLQRIVDVLDMMDVDHDGQVEIEHVVKVLELVGRENVEVSANQMKDIIKLLIQEEKLEEEKKRKAENKQAENASDIKSEKKEL